MAVTSYKFAGTIVSETISGGNSTNWTNPSNAGADDTSYATLGLTTASADQGAYLKFTNFGFTSGDVPSGATIDGIECEYGRFENSVADNIVTNRCRIVKGGTIHTANVSTMNTVEWATSIEVITEGGASNLWGLTWVDTDITSSTFGVAIAPDCPGTTPDANIDYAKLRIYYTAGDVTANPTGNAGTGSAGTITVTGDANIDATGNAGTGSAGDLTVTLLLNVPVTGNAGTGAAGDVTVTADANVTPTGVAGTGSAGTVTVTADANVDVTGNAGTGAAGELTVTITGDVSVDITGVEASGAVGTPTVTGDANTGVTGDPATGAVGDPTVTADANAPVTGNEGAGSAGDVTVDIGAGGDVDVYIDGVEATGQAGDVTVTAENNATQAGKPSKASPYPKKYLFRDQLVWVRSPHEERELYAQFLADELAKQERDTPKQKKLSKRRIKRKLAVTLAPLDEIPQSQAAEPDYAAQFESWMADQAMRAANDDNEAILLLMMA